ncbi:hypothetical protein R1flu_026634 [Riccia fluitans]|uniref:Uncharacterized protein n=1 Tax=Riccia fluitans TaxID=41844 RepID=A0ABD1XGI7_9MARC
MDDLFFLCTYSPEQLEKARTDAINQEETNNDRTDIINQEEPNNRDPDNNENVLLRINYYPFNMRDIGDDAFRETQVPQQRAIELPADDETWKTFLRDPDKESEDTDVNRESDPQSRGRTSPREPNPLPNPLPNHDERPSPNPNSPPGGSSAVDRDESEDDEGWGDWTLWRSTPVREGWYDLYPRTILNDARAAIARESDTNEASPNWPNPEIMKGKAEEENDQLNTIRWSFVHVMLAEIQFRLHQETARSITTELQFLVDLYRVSSSFNTLLIW